MDSAGGFMDECWAFKAGDAPPPTIVRLLLPLLPAEAAVADELAPEVVDPRVPALDLDFAWLFPPVEPLAEVSPERLDECRCFEVATVAGDTGTRAFTGEGNVFFLDRGSSTDERLFMRGLEPLPDAVPEVPPTPPRLNEEAERLSVGPRAGDVRGEK